MPSTQPHIDTQALSAALLAHLPLVIADLLPAAQLHGTQYRVGSVAGESGSSLALDSATGLWIDHSTGDSGDLLELIRNVRNCTFREALAWASGLLGRDFSGSGNAGPAPQPKHSRPTELRSQTWEQLESPSNTQLSQISELLGIGRDGLVLASQRRHLFCSGPDLFTITDSMRHVRADRRLDGSGLAIASGKRIKTRTLGTASWPVGCADFGHRPYVLLCEGFSDFLAGCHLVAIEGVEDIFSVCAVLGAGIGIHPQSLPHFKGRCVLIFADADGPGIRGARRWREQLKPISRAVRFFNLKGLVRDDGEPIKDLRDFLRIDVDAWESEEELRYPLAHAMQHFPKPKP